MTGRRGKKTGDPAGSSHVKSPVVDATAARKDAFVRYVEPEITVMLRVAQTLTGSWADAEDLVQDTMIRAYRAIDRFDGAHPRAWLLTILRRAHLNAHRRQRPDLLSEPSTLHQHRPAFGARSAPSAEESVTDLVPDEALQRAVNTLDPRFRTVLLLVDVDQLTYAEVAEVLGIPTGTVMSRLSRARHRVRAYLRDAYVSRRTR